MRMSKHVFPGATVALPRGSDTSAASIEAKLMTLRIAGRRVEVVGPMHTTTPGITDVAVRDTGELAVDLRDDSGRVLHALARVELDRVHASHAPIRDVDELRVFVGETASSDLHLRACSGAPRKGTPCSG
jgi:hypothetical protein